MFQTINSGKGVKDTAIPPINLGHLTRERAYLGGRCNLEKEGNLKAVFAQNPCELVMIMKKLPVHD